MQIRKDKEEYMYYKIAAGVENIPLVQEPHKRKNSNYRNRINNQIKINKLRYERYSIFQTGAFVIAAVLLLLSLVFYVRSRSRLTESSYRLNKIKSEYALLKRDNQSIEKTITDFIDPEIIYNSAINSGMHYPAKSQVITYKRTESGYLTQNEKIPE